MKRMLSACMAALLLNGAAVHLPIPVQTAFAEDTQETEANTYGKMTYQAADDHIEITGCFQTATKIDIPAEIDGLPVTVIQRNAFSNCAYLREITFPDTLNEIGMDAFTGTKWLEEQKKTQTLVIVNHILIDGTNAEGAVEIPGDVTYIAGKAFQNAAITSVLIQDQVKTIGDYAFSNCASLISADMMGGVVTIGMGAFSSCKALTELVIPETVRHIEPNAFQGCYTLPAVQLPDGLESIGAYAFGFCKALKTLNMPESVTSIGASAFYNTIWLKDRQNENPVVVVNQLVVDGSTVSGVAVIPDSVTEICDRAFEGNKNLNGVITDSIVRIGLAAFNSTGLQSLSLPKTVTEIGKTAFSNCAKLPEILVSEDNPAYVSENGVLFDRAKTELLCYPAGKNDTKYTVPDSVTTIDAEAFSCCNLAAVTLPASVSSIGLSAFQTCAQLKEITILNPDCKINAAKSTLSTGINRSKHYYNGTIYGYDNSTAQEYASNNSCRFSSLGEAPQKPGYDVNGDGKVNLKDVVYLRRYIAGGWDLEIDTAAADVNADGVINLKDVVLLRRKIAGGWE